MSRYALEFNNLGFEDIVEASSKNTSPDSDISR